MRENIEEIILPLAQKVLVLPTPERLIEVPDDIQRTVGNGQNQYVL